MSVCVVENEKESVHHTKVAMTTTTVPTLVMNVLLCFLGVVAATKTTTSSSSCAPSSATHTLSLDGIISKGWTNQDGIPVCAGVSSITTPRPLGSGATGVTLSVWHSPAVAALNEVKAKGGPALSIEDVIRSRGALSMSEVYDKWGVNDEDALYYQSFPAAGPYCMYRHRPNETGLLPDCENITETATRHAAVFTAAGIDFVALDATNLCTPSDQIEVIQTRPIQVLFEEWAALRAAGLNTPAIAPWWRITTGCTLHTVILSLYNDPRYESLILRDGVSGKKIWYSPADPDPTIIQFIESNGGRNDITIITMWANFAENEYDEGVWTFMSPCVDNTSNTYTTSVVSPVRGATGCGQRVTHNSSAGTSVTVAASYQLSYGSVPFSSAGQYDGLTLKRQFGTIFDNAAAAWRTSASVKGATTAVSAFPNNVLLSTYNEAVAQPQINPFLSSSNYSFSMGLLAAAPVTRPLFVDSYGQSLRRDLEPSTESSVIWDIVTSCLSVLRVAAVAERLLVPELSSNYSSSDEATPAAFFAHLSLTERLELLARSFGSNSLRGTACNVAGEICCAYNASVDGWAPVWSFVVSGSGGKAALPGAAMALTSSDPREVAHLLAPGSGFAERCNAYGGPTDFCIDQEQLKTLAAVSGPFVLRAAGCGAAASASGIDPEPTLPGRVGVFRCLNITNGAHYLSGDRLCAGSGGGAAPDATIGCADDTISGAMPRSLAACMPLSDDMWPFHILDFSCPQEGFRQVNLGYVR